MAIKSFDIVKLNFCTPLHLSRGQTDSYDRSEEILHSDSLKSAIFVAAKMLFGDEIDEEFFKSFKVSSAFPYKGGDFFFPKPMAKLSLAFENIDPEKQVSKLSKKLKKIEFISKNLFESIISGENDIQIKDKQLDKNGKFLFATEIDDEKEKQVYKSEVQQRLSMPKPFVNDQGEEVIEKDGTPYYVDRIYFTQNSGLYFFIDYEKANKSKIQAAIKLLGDEGVGTDKHIGNGIFEPDFKTLDLNLPTSSNSQLLLSLYCPKEDELEVGDKNMLYDSSYQLIKRGGYIASAASIEHITYRKKSVYMFQEASVFPSAMQLVGKIEDLNPEVSVGHPVWRDGMAFSIPFVKHEEL